MELLEGEKLQFEPVEDIPSENASDDELNERYARGEIRIVTEQARYPLNTIAQMIQGPNYKLSPEYQRRRRWGPDRKSRLIESLIMNVPIPPIFLYEYDYSKYEVMDGLQRLSTIHDFYSDAFELSTLTQWPELNGRTYSRLPEKLREGIDRRYLSSVILLKETAKSEEEALRLKQMVFERLNSGGTHLEPQETRNAIYDGSLNQLCIKLSRNPSLCRLWDIPEASKDEGQEDASPSLERLSNEAFQKMEDVELVLRFFAYRQKHDLHRGTNLARYLDAFLKYGNKFDNTLLGQLSDLFISTIELVEEVFGPGAFWLYRPRNGNWRWLERPTITVYDPLMLAVSNYATCSQKLLARKSDILEKLPVFYEQNYSTFEGRNVNPSILKERDSKFSEFLTALAE